MRKMLLVLLLSSGCSATWTQFRIDPCENPVEGVSQAERSFYATLVSLRAKKYEISRADPSSRTIVASLDRTVWSAAEIRKRHYEVDWLIGVEPDGTVTVDVEKAEMPKRQYQVYLGWARKFAAVFRTNRCRAIDVLRREVQEAGLIPGSPTDGPPAPGR